MADTLSGIVWILYIVLGYWSVGQTIMQTKLLWSDGNIVDQKIYTWLYVWLGINSGCYYKVFDFSLNKSR